MRQLVIVLLSVIFMLEIKAQSTFSQALDIFLLANQQIETGDKEGAIHNLNLVIKTDSTFRSAYISLNEIYISTENQIEQERLLKKAIQVFKEDYLFHYYLGRYYQSKSDYNNAIESITTAINGNLSKQSVEGYMMEEMYSNRAICYLRISDFAKALIDFDQAIELNDLYASVYANRGYCLYRLNRKDEACKSWQKAKELEVPGVQTYIEKYCK